MEIKNKTIKDLINTSKLNFDKAYEYDLIKANLEKYGIKGVCYYRIQDKWMYAKSGDVIAGDVVHRGGVEIKSYEYKN